MISFAQDLVLYLELFLMSPYAPVNHQKEGGTIIIVPDAQLRI